MWPQNPAEPLHQVGASVQLHLAEPFYVGIGLCSHDPNKTEKAVFSHVSSSSPPRCRSTLALYSTLNTIGDDKDFRRDVVVWSAQAHLKRRTGAATAKR